MKEARAVIEQRRLNDRVGKRPALGTDGRRNDFGSKCGKGRQRCLMRGQRRKVLVRRVVERVSHAHTHTHTID